MKLSKTCQALKRDRAKASPKLKNKARFGGKEKRRTSMVICWKSFWRLLFLNSSYYKSRGKNYSNARISIW